MIPLVGLSVRSLFKRNALECSHPQSQSQSPLVFKTRNYGYVSPWHWNPGLAGTSQPSGDCGVPQQPKNLFRSLWAHVGVAPAQSMSLPIPPVWRWLLLRFLS